MSGFVYFIRRKSGPIKIGFTSGSPLARVAAIRTASDEPVELITAVKGTVEDEKSLHVRFAAFRLAGEWFSPVPGLLDYIAELPGFDPASVPERQPNEYVAIATDWVRNAVWRVSQIHSVKHEKACAIFSQDAGLTKNYAAWLLKGKARFITIDDWNKIDAARVKWAEEYLRHICEELAVLRDNGMKAGQIDRIDDLLSRTKALMKVKP